MKKQRQSLLGVLFTGVVFLLITVSHAWATPAEEILIKEEFADNTLGWPVLNDRDIYAVIKEGKYFINCISPTKANLAGIAPKGLNYSENYTIEALIKKAGGMENNSYGVFWGGKDAGSHYRFEITGNGLMAIYSCEDYTALPPHIGWVQQAAINRSNSENRFSIMKMGKYVHFFINGRYAGSLKGQFYFGKHLGFITQSEMAVEADYFHVLQGLRKELVEELPETFQRDVVRISFDNVRAHYEGDDRQLTFKIIYSLKDALASQDEVLINMSCKVQQGDDIIYSDDFEKNVILGEHLTMKVVQSPVDLEKGKYFMQLQIQYQDEVVQESTRFVVK
ncbi:MAG: hypothetical protein KAR05_10125 [Candidatus Omnitrophica bacterium]|nr:hypothetical protein [Candidatus Omnitrophota bacterium]